MEKLTDGRRTPSDGNSIFFLIRISIEPGLFPLILVIRHIIQMLCYPHTSLFGFLRVYYYIVLLKMTVCYNLNFFHDIMNSTISELTQSSLNNFLKIGKTKGGKCRA
jgi:hypothetical protein